MSYNNQLVPKKPWLYRNWKWLVPVVFVILLLVFVIIITKDIITGMGTAMADPALIEQAKEKAQNNPEVTSYFGTELQVGSIIEGDVLIHENGKTIRVTFPLKGNKGSGMIDIYAHLAYEKWKHDSIDVRLKKPEKHTIKLPR